MVLKTEEIVVGGKKVTVKELSMAGHLRLEEQGANRKASDLYKECVSPEHWKELLSIGEELPFADYKKLIDAVDRVNGYTK